MTGGVTVVENSLAAPATEKAQGWRVVRVPFKKEFTSMSW
jgi:hypothetical protein